MGAGHSLTRQDLEVYEACTCLSGSDIIELWYKFTDLGGVRGKDVDTEKAIKGSGAQMRFSVLNDIEATTSTNNPVPPEETGRRVTRAAVMAQPEFKHNPLKGRLCQIFTSVVDESSPQYGDLTFDEFVDMYNCLSPHAPLEVKMQTAFRLYDFDNNGYLTKEDIAMLLKTITFVPPKGEEELLDNETRENIIERVMKDCTRAAAHTLEEPGQLSLPIPHHYHCSHPHPPTQRAGDIDGNNRLSYAEFSKVLLRMPDFRANFTVHIM